MSQYRPRGQPWAVFFCFWGERIIGFLPTFVLVYPAFMSLYCRPSFALLLSLLVVGCGSSSESSAENNGSSGSSAGGSSAGGSSSGGSSSGGSDSAGSSGSGQGGSQAGAAGNGAQSGSSGAGGSNTGATAGSSGSSGSGGCTPGAVESCYSGPVGTENVGICKSGQKTCNPDGSGFGSCEGEVLPQATESCASTEDENCDGQQNEGCPCMPGTSLPCYTGPAGTKDIGSCKAGTKSCLPDGTGYGACEGETIPQSEDCDAALEDEDCDGFVNEEGISCICAPGAISGCYDGPDGTQFVGICLPGTKTCDASGLSYGPCMDQVLPEFDSCLTDDDEDCTGASTVCMGNEECSPTGHCEDPCSPAKLGRSYQGCEYYPTVTANMVDSGTFHYSVAVSNTSNKPTTVTVTKGAATITTVDVAANSVQIINLPWESTLKGPSSLFATPMPSSSLVAQGAYRLTTTRPVTVYQYSPLEYTIGGAYSYTNDASLLLPVNVWSGNYRVMARHHWAGTSGFLTVTASQDNTTVNVQKGPKSGIVKAGIPGIGTDGNGSVVLNRGDVFQLVTDGGGDLSDPNDVTGTLVTADKPVQALGGHQCTNVPDSTGYCDHLEESMFPIESTATEYLISTPLIQVGVPKASIVRIMAIDPNVTLSYDPPQGGAPGSLGAGGDWQEFQTSGNFKITASGRVLVGQYMLGQDAGGGSGDPALSLAVATFQYRTDYLFHAPTNYDLNFVTITAPANANVTLDGSPVSGFTAIGGSGYGYLNVALPNSNGGNHNVSSDQPVGITVYGYGQYTSYWYPGGLNLNTF